MLSPPPPPYRVHWWSHLSEVSSSAARALGTTLPHFRETQWCHLGMKHPRYSSLIPASELSDHFWLHLGNQVLSSTLSFFLPSFSFHSSLLSFHLPSFFPSFPLSFSFHHSSFFPSFFLPGFSENISSIPALNEGCPIACPDFTFGLRLSCKSVLLGTEKCYYKQRFIHSFMLADT